MQDKKLILISIISMFLVALILLGGTFALWFARNVQEGTNRIASLTCLATSINDVTDAININNAYPITNEDGMNTKPYSFSITNNCDIYVSVDITLEVQSLTTMPLEYVRVSLHELGGTIDNSRILNDDFLLETEIILSPNEVLEYDLRIWMDASTPYEEGRGTTFISKVVLLTAPASDPGPILVDLDENMIPIMWDLNTDSWVKANRHNKGSYAWYDYDNFQWANAVLVTDTNRENYKIAPAGTTIPETDILAYFVYIPRYRYQLWNVANDGINKNPQIINIEFQKKTDPKSNGSINGDWLTHPAFTFGTTELNGIWVGKFQTTGSVMNPTIKPNLASLANQNVYTQFTTAKGFNTHPEFGINTNDAINVHMMKNIEWGAVTYLSQSIYGFAGNPAFGSTITTKRMYINNLYSSNQSRTGCSAGNHNAGQVTTCAHPFPNNGTVATNSNTGTSTTGTIYGIYDMVGALYESVMGVMDNANGTPFQISSSGFFSVPDTKYWDRYEFSNSQNYNRGLLGDATKETMANWTSADINAWYDAFSLLNSGTLPWLVRGGIYNQTVNASAFSFVHSGGNPNVFYAFRSVLVFE